MELRSSKELAEQRVTLLGPRRRADQWKADLQELLTPAQQAGVFWTRAEGGEGALLRESKNRRELAARLRDSDQELFRRFVAERYEWAQKEGWPALNDPKSRTPRRALVDQLGILMLLDAYGAEGRDRLFAGEPLIVPFSRFVGTEQEALFREWFKYRTPDLVDVPSDELGQYAYVFLRERSPIDPRGGGFTVCLVKPSGFVPMHGTILRMPHRTLNQQQTSGFVVPMSTAEEPGRRVTLCLTPVPAAKPGEVVERTMDELLEVLARETGITVVADGYLRPAVQVPANLLIRDCTVERVMKSIADAWDCEWRLADGGSTVMLRAKHWWLEDAANVPPEQVKDLTQRLGAGKPPALEDLALLAELEEPQVRKLLDLGLCKSAGGLMGIGMHDGVGPRQILQFYNRLPAALQERVRSQQGLPLAVTDPALAQRWLLRLLTTIVGAITPERREALVLSITPLAPRAPGAASPGWRFGIRSAEGSGSRCNWFAYVLPRSQPVAEQ